jgi:hypothetical protein
MVFSGCKQKKIVVSFALSFCVHLGVTSKCFTPKPFFWQKDLNFEASGENAFLGELTINWTFTFLHKSFGSQSKESWSGEGRGGGEDHKVM